MRILLAAMSLGIGGAETHIAELAKQLVRRGHDVTVASAGGVYENEITQAGVKHVFAPLSTRAPLDMCKALKILSRLIREGGFDVVHAHARIPAFLCGLLHRKYKFNFITTAHWVFDTRGSLKYLTNWGERTIAVSEDIKKYLLDNYRVDEQNIFVTVNGIDTERFSPGVTGKYARRELKIPDGAPALVCVSRLDRTLSAPTVTVRGLLEAAPALARAIPDLRIVIVGGGDAQDDFRELGAIVNRELGRDAVIFTGARTDVNELLAMADLFVGVSRAALEALATGIPTLLAGSEGYLGLFTPEKLGDAVRTNFTCRGYGSTDAKSLTRDITDFFAGHGTPAHEGTSARLGAFGRDTVIKSYSVTRMTDDCERAYASFKRPSLPHRRVVMSGYYGFGNAGDEAIMQSVYSSIAAARPATEITVLSKSPRATREKYGFRAVGRFNPFRAVYAIARSDALVFGGGSLLQDSTSTRSLLYYLAVIKAARFFRRPVMIYANGIGPVTHPKNRERVRRAVESAAAVTLRDEKSRSELRAMGVARTDLTVTSDPVFTAELPDEAESRRILAAAGIDRARPFFAVSARDWRGSPEFFGELARFCDLARAELDLDVVFLPMQPKGDLETSRAILAKMTSPAVIPPSELSPRELMAILARAEFAVSMRLHTLIFAARVGTPSLGVVVDPKVTAYLEALGMPELGTMEDFTAERALFRAIEVSQRRAELSSRLRSLAEEYGNRAKEDARILAKLLED